MARKNLGLLSSADYQALVSEWQSVRKEVFRCTPKQLAASKHLQNNYPDILENVMLQGLELDCRDWINPVRNFGTLSSNSRLISNLTNVASALCGGKLVVAFPDTDTVVLPTLQQLVVQIAKWETFKEPMKLTTIRYSISHRSFANYLQDFCPQLPHSESEIRAFFRRYKIENTAKPNLTKADKLNLYSF